MTQKSDQLTTQSLLNSSSTLIYAYERMTKTPAL